MSDEEDTPGELEDQLSALELDVADEPEDSESDDNEEPDEGRSQGDSDPLTPREQFEKAVRELDDDQLGRANGAREAGAPDRSTESASEEGEEGQENDPETEEVWREDSGGDRSRFAEGLESMDREALPEATPERAPDHGGSDEVNAAEENAPSPREEFERSLEDLSASEMRRKKFDDSTAEARSGDEEEQTDAEDRASRSENDRRATDGPLTGEEEATFEAAMRDVEPMETDTSKHRTRSTSRFERFFKETASRTSDDFVTPTLPKSGEGLTEIPPLDESQEQMLERCESWSRGRELPELNLRGDRVEEARDRLGRFLHQAWSEGRRFVRVVHGRGRHSDGPPVLKPVVLEWLEERAAPYLVGYAPERSIGGDYGSIVVELRWDQD